MKFHDLHPASDAVIPIGRRQLRLNPYVAITPWRRRSHSCTDVRIWTLPCGRSNAIGHRPATTHVPNHAGDGRSCPFGLT